jgi:hypothetical protein
MQVNQATRLSLVTRSAYLTLVWTWRGTFGALLIVSFIANFISPQSPPEVKAEQWNVAVGVYVAVEVILFGISKVIVDVLLMPFSKERGGNYRNARRRMA